ncbi:MAG: hypothetical protein WCJ60_00325 [bacterium]
MKTYSVFPALIESDVANIEVGENFIVLATPDLVAFSKDFNFDNVSRFVIRATNKEVDNIHAFVGGLVLEPPVHMGQKAVLTVSWLNSKDFRSILDVQ